MRQPARARCLASLTALQVKASTQAWTLSTATPPVSLPAAHVLLGRYADRCYASFDHGKQMERDTGALVLCCVSLCSAYPVISRSDMNKLQGKGNYQNYDAHIVPVVPADGGNPRELTYFPCEAASLSPPFPGATTLATAPSPANKRPPSPSLSGFTYMELVLFESAQVTRSLASASRRLIHHRFSHALSFTWHVAAYRVLSCLRPALPASSTSATTACCKATVCTPQPARSSLEPCRFSPSWSHSSRRAKLPPSSVGTSSSRTNWHLAPRPTSRAPPRFPSALKLAAVPSERYFAPSGRALTWLSSS